MSSGEVLSERGDGEPRLTVRQMECLQRVARGFSARETAHELGISELTVKHHLASAYDTLGASGHLEAFRRLGWLKI